MMLKYGTFEAETRLIVVCCVYEYFRAFFLILVNAFALLKAYILDTTLVFLSFL